MAKQLTPKSGAQAVDAFVAAVRSAPKPGSGGGRLVFALDATASREATWDRASSLHAEMFEEATAHGGLSVQLCYYRGFRDFFASPWVSRPRALLEQMTGTRCAAGMTQLERLLGHVRAEAARQKIGALIFVGDAFEEQLDPVADAAGQLGLVGCPAFMFQEGHDLAAERAFKAVAELSGGAWCRFDAGSARQLRELLRAVAAFVAGGRPALEALEGGTLTKRLTQQVRR